MWNPFKKQTNSEVMVYTKEQQQADSYFGIVLNAVRTISSRFSNCVFGITPDGKRDYNQLFGYGIPSFEEFYQMYKYGGIAGVICGKLPKACWRDMPEIFDGNDNQILKKELRILKRMGFFKAMERADILNRIGTFSVLLIGIPDGEDLNKPVGSARRGSFKGMYFNVYHCKGAEIVKYDTDPASARYGLPELYQLQVIDLDGSSKKQIVTTSRIAHYSRIVHFAEGALDNTIEGTSALEQPWRCLLDKEKTRGSSAESYYRNSRQKLALEAEGGAQVTKDKQKVEQLKENVKNFQDGFEDVLRLQNMKANMLQPQMASPRDTFDICVEEIAGTTGIPIRILTTKAGGVVTGSEDKATWNALILDRQDQECSVNLIDALQIMANAGIIELPEDVEIVWPKQSALSEVEASEVSKNKADAFKSAVDGLSSSGADQVKAKSVFKEIGFEDVEIEDVDFDDDDDETKKVVDELIQAE